MNIFIDTAAFLAVLNAEDQFHLPARQCWQELLSSDTTLFTSNYILLETNAVEDDDAIRQKLLLFRERISRLEVTGMVTAVAAVTLANLG